MSKKIKLIDDSYKTREEGIENNNEKCRKSYINGNKLDDYSEFKRFLIDEWVSKPTRDDYFATQGLCHVGGNVLITSYDPTDREPDKDDKKYNEYQEKYAEKLKTGEEDKDLETNFSRLDIVDESGRRKQLYFDNHAHVGGIAYHEASGKFFVSNDSKVNIYETHNIANAKNKTTITADDSFSIKDDVKQASYLTVNNDNLFVGKFEEKGNGSLAKYELNDNGEIVGEPKKYTVPYKNVQGLAIYEKDGQEYYIFSSSHGRKNDSELIISTLEDGEFKSVGKVKLPSMVEQISVDDKGRLGIVFESDSEYYKGATKEIGNVCYMDIDKAIDNHLEIRDGFDNLFKSGKDLVSSIVPSLRDNDLLAFSDENNRFTEIKNILSCNDEVENEKKSLMKDDFDDTFNL